MNNNIEPPLKPGYYQHYKGAYYQVIDVARHSETEEWLVRHNVMYSKLIMHPAATPEQRRQMNDHAIQKSEAYKSMTEANFFIESDVRQAAQIFKLTQRPVLCIDTMTMFK